MARPLRVAQVYHLWRSALPSALHLFFFRPLLPLLFLLLCGFLFPLSRFFVTLLVSYFRPTLVRLSCRLSGQTNRREGPRRARRHVAGFCLPGLILVPGESFLKRCAERSKAQHGDCNTNICPPPPTSAPCLQCLMCCVLPPP